MNMENNEMITLTRLSLNYVKTDVDTKFVH
jgi:hypothetical protein